MEEFPIYERKRRRSAIAPLSFFVMSLLLYFIISGISLLFPSKINPIVANGSAQILGLFLPTFFAVKYFKLNVNIAGKTKFFSLRNISILLSVFILLYAINGALGSLISRILPKEIFDNINQSVEEAYSKFFEMKNISDYLLALFFAALTPAIVEEYLFRGFLLKTLLGDYTSKGDYDDERQSISRNRLTASFAIVSFIFALIHLNPLSFVFLFCFSMLLCYLSYKTNSLLPSMSLHFINNLLAISAFFIKADAIGETPGPNINVALAIFVAIGAGLTSIHIIKKLRF